MPLRCDRAVVVVVVGVLSTGPCMFISVQPYKRLLRALAPLAHSTGLYVYFFLEIFAHARPTGTQYWFVHAFFSCPLVHSTGLYVCFFLK
jgi:hypothetical protein